MDAELQNLFALQVKVTDDCIIEEKHTTISNKEIVKQWEATVYKKLRNKLFNHATGDTFQEVLKEYLRILKERATHFKDKLLLKEVIVKHLNFFYLYYDEFSATRCANLNYVESILLIVCSLELEFVRHMKKNNFANKEYIKITNCIAQRLIYSLTLYLLNEERRIFHVLLRLEIKSDSLAWKDVMHIVYSHYLTILPVRDYSDEGFCRHYLLFQKFKNVTDKTKHEGMDKILYFRFNKTPSSIKENKILRSILLPSANSIADLVDVLADGQQAAVNMYFRYIEQNNEDGNLQAIDIDSDDEEICENSLNSFHSIEKQFDSVVKSENSLKTNLANVSCPKSSSHEEVVCIIEDDSDIEVVEDEEESIKTLTQSCPIKEPKSFLESISCSEDIATVASNNLSLVLPVATISSDDLSSTKVVEAEEATLSTQDDSHTNDLVAKYLEYMQIDNHQIDDHQTGDHQMDDHQIDDHQIENHQIDNHRIDDEMVTKSTSSKTTPVDESHSAAVDTLKESENICNTTTVTQDCEKEKNVINNENAMLTHCISNNNNVQNKTSIELSNSVSNLNEIISVHKCTCLCAHECSKNAENVNNRTENCSVKTSLRTVEIQTENYDNNCDVMCGLDTPPPSEDISTTCTDTVPHSDDSEISKSTEPEKNLTIKSSSSQDEMLVTEPVLNQTRLHLPKSVSNKKVIEEEPKCNIDVTCDDAASIHESDNTEELRDLPELSPSSNNEIDKNRKQSQSDTVVAPVDLIFNDYSNANISKSKNVFENVEDQLLHDYPNTDEESLDNVSLTIDENSQPVLENDNATVENVGIVENIAIVKKIPQIISSFESFSKNGVENNVNKIKTSVNTANANKINLNKPMRLNGNTSKFSEEIKNKSKSSNILFTSNERVSAPLSVFSKFEQDQSDFSIDSLLNEPIHSINERSIEHSDNTNSSDSLSLTSYSRPYSTTKASSLNNSPVNSPISSPPYEYIQSQDFMKHIISIDNHLTSCQDVCSKSIPTSLKNVIDTNKHKTNSNLLGKSSIISKSGNKRKRIDSGNPIKKPKVNFGNIETRLISPRPDRLISQEVLNLATDSMQEYRINNNDKKLIYCKPQVLLQLDTQKQLESKIKDLQLCSVLINILEKKGTDKIPDKTCILDRFDYKKPAKEVLQSELLANKQVESLTKFNLTSLSSLSDLASISGHSTSSNYKCTSSPIISVKPEAPVVEKATDSRSNRSRTKQTNSVYSNSCKDQSNDLDEILNLSISAKATHLSELPESEFSRSPKFLHNPDQIVQECLMNNILENNDTLISINKNITFLSDNSNFYTTTSINHPCKSANNNEGDDGVNGVIDESDIDKLVDEQIKNYESETCLPLKKRRVPVSEKLAAKSELKIPPYKEEISYPATPMISIAEIEVLRQNQTNATRPFKTPAERKEMPPLPMFYNINTTEPSPIITDQFNINNHTYNNPTINYHMNNVPVPFINVPCASYYSLPPILLPFNNIHSFDTTNSNLNLYNNEDSKTAATKNIKKEKRRRVKKEKCCAENYYLQNKYSNSNLF